MAKTDGKPIDDSLAGSFDALKRDLMAWIAAERALLHARMTSSARRVACAAAMIAIALMATFVALTVLANVLVQALADSLGPLTAGLVVGLGLLLLGIILAIAARSLLVSADPLSGRLRSNAKFIWSQFNDQA